MKFKANLVAGYSSWHGPLRGTGPFEKIFPNSRPLNEYTDFDLVDALFLWGGEDISPSLYHEEPIQHAGPIESSVRDIYEWELLRQANIRKLPIIGICRGAQIMCTFAGGTLIQNVDNHKGTQGKHNIVTTEGDLISTSGDHHQMMSPNNVHHKVLAWAFPRRSTVYQPDGTYGSAQLEKKVIPEPEVVFFPKINGLAIQPHPEWMAPDCEFFKYLEETIHNVFPTIRNPS